MMNYNFENMKSDELEKISGGSVVGAFALAWGVTKAVGIIGGTAVSVYVAGKSVKAIGDWGLSRLR
ncbi:class IIb bacteriocin, lactobin A/cerein 7B family [Streptococcus mitis]|uniref:class IIb bacteriocin, lactobin A/cerein 7B family n=1 Tax=Streptococcus mitis TaxID=28037 RepID=UPI0020012FC6|nr:class IIb bacteriocin, lactobin A/cerein 7B family [Streptococcus mitis]